jgi:hypothetical protein
MKFKIQLIYKFRYIHFYKCFYFLNIIGKVSSKLSIGDAKTGEHMRTLLHRQHRFAK